VCNVIAAPEIIPQTCKIPLTVATPYPHIAALCKYANTLGAPTFPSIDWSQAAIEPNAMQESFSLDLTTNTNYDYSPARGPEAPKPIVARRGPVRAAGVKTRIQVVVSKALRPRFAVTLL
jgi:hypothetical protein